VAPLSYIHHYEPGSDQAAPPLLLLHGTGGNEHDLVPLGRRLSPGSALLSPRGDVDEHGHLRFFRRLAEGVFDLADVEKRTHALAGFIAAAAQQYGFAPSRLTALGLSNGANIAATLLLLHPESLAGAVLLRPMVVLNPAPLPDLRGKHILISSGVRDPIVPPDHPARLMEMFRSAGAEVERRVHPAGHHLVAGDFEAAKDFLATTTHG
jgi:phospholipase/carboxylesterase